ncbi:MAG: hypothetical protein GY803_29535, partial [Chloroflexi bacterium]|nr:hypothetical protein [Chloroflexota bacterium]
MIGVPVLVFVLTTTFHLPPFLVGIGMFLGFVLAWVWWSFNVPKWRLWALERVEDIPQLYKKAISYGIMWSRGHFFEKTEIRSKNHTFKEKELEIAYFIHELPEKILHDNPEIRNTSQDFLGSLDLPASIEERVTIAKSILDTILDQEFQQDAEDRIITGFEWLLRIYVDTGNALV